MDDDPADPTERRAYRNRRRFLRGLGTLGVAGLAGCSGDDGADTDTPEPSSSPTDTRGSSTLATTTPEDGGLPADRPDLGSDPALLVIALGDDDAHADAREAGTRVVGSLADRIGEAGGRSITVDVVDDATEEPGEAIPSTVEGFAAYDAVVFANATGAVLDTDRRAAFREYVTAEGGGWVGVHAAADANSEWEWFETLAGARYETSAPLQDAELHVTDRVHPSTRHFPARSTREDAWITYSTNPRGDAHVLATVDESTYQGGEGDGAFSDLGTGDHPIAWCRELGAGRSWYTGLGHTAEALEDPAVRKHLAGGLMWAAGYVKGDGTGTVWDAFSTDTLVGDLNQPMTLDVAPDGRVVFVERGGAVKVVDPGTGESHTALELDVYTGQEDGLLGIVLDPSFPETGWLYFYYSPPDDEIDDAHNRLSRFEMAGGTIDRATEAELLRVPTQRETCCHEAGAMAFDGEGNLYLATGDDTNPFESDGYAPMDEREGRQYFDAQRSAADTSDLRGSVLRITPTEDGSYEIPDGNLFTEANGDGEAIEAGTVRPEIYAMGLRNPFTMHLDPATDTPYLADYGPDGPEWDPDRGPPGMTEFVRLEAPGNYGWPYCVGQNIPYREYDFETDEPGAPFDPDALTNTSPNCDGLEELPPAKGSLVTEPYNWSEYLDYPEDWAEHVPYAEMEEVPFPQVFGGAPMQGPIVRGSEGHASEGLPASYEGKVFLMDWNDRSSWVKYLTLDDDGQPMEIDPFLPDYDFLSPMDMAVGPEGALYMLEYGEGWSGTEKAKLTRITRTA